MKNWVMIGCLLASSSVFSADLKAPFALPSAKVLPKGVRNLSYKNIMASAENKYGANGQSVSLADPLFKNITFADVIKGKTDPADKGAITQAMYAIGAKETDSFGSTTGQVNIKATAHVPVFAIGVSKKMTVAIVVPIIESSMNVSTGVIQDNQAMHDKMKAELSAKGVDDKVAELDYKMNDPIPSKAEDFGYKAPVNENKTVLGDVQMVAKYMAHEDDHNRIVFSSNLVAPTGKDNDVNEMIDVASGDSQWDIGLGVSHDYSLSDTVTFSSEMTYTVQLADQNPERVPFLDNSKATPYIDFNTQRDLGDILATTFSTKYRNEGWNLGAGYSFQYKQGDKYTGSLYAAQNYHYLEVDTQQNMQTLILTAGFDTLSLFKAKKFPVPLMLTFGHSRVLAGKNVVNDPLTSVDFSMFF